MVPYLHKERFSDSVHTIKSDEKIMLLEFLEEKINQLLNGKK